MTHAHELIGTIILDTLYTIIDVILIMFMFETLLEINWGSLKSAKNITDDLNLKLKNAQHQIKTQEVEIAELKSKCIELEQYITGLAYCVKDIEDHINKTFSTDIRFINPFGGAIPEA